MNIIICKELEKNPSVSPFAVEITDPSKTTVSDLKTRVSETLSIAKEELILYFDNGTLPESIPLSDWKGLRKGAVVMAVIKPVKITLQRYTSPVDVIFTIPKQAIEKWSTKMFFDCCLYKGGLPYLMNGRYVFAVKGNIIKEEGKKISEYECFKNDLTISVTFIQSVTKMGSKLGEFYAAFPSTSFMETTLRYQVANTYWSTTQFLGENESTRNNANMFSDPWILKIKLLEGNETTVQVKQHYFTPVFQLRQQISPDNIIRLTIGSTILEDWDEEGNMMLLCNYPDLHDGATLYQINLTGGIRVKYTLVNWSGKEETPSKQLQAHNTNRLVERNIISYFPPKYIEIADPKAFTLKKLKNVGKNFASRDIKRCKQLQDQPEDAPISSLSSIYDGCTITFYTQF